MKSKTIILSALLLLSVSLVNAQTKIGYVNSLELLSLMPEIKKADSTLQVLAGELQKQYGLYVMEYQQKLDDYNKNAATWTDVKREATEQDLLSLQQRISDFEESSQKKVDTKKQELYEPVLKRANDAIQEVGKENKFTYILDSSVGALVYVGEELVDIMPMVKTKLKL